MNKQKSWIKFIALLVCLAVAVTAMPFAAFAEEETTEETTGTTTTGDTAEETSKTGSESSDPVETSTADTTDGSEVPGESGQTEPPATETDPVGPSASVVTITIAAGENGNALYLDAGVAVTDAMLLAGVSAVDESGEAMAVTVADTGGLDRENPQPKGEPGSPEAYVITYAAGEVTATRECFVTAGVVALAIGPAFTITLTGGGDPAGGEDYAFGMVDGVDILTIMSDKAMTIKNTGTGPTNARIVVASGTANITLAGVNINTNAPAFDMAGATVNLTLEGTNTLTSSDPNSAGLHAPGGPTLTISGDGELAATGGAHSAGIGGSYQEGSGTIIINSGTVTATSGDYGAGIGGGDDGSAGPITINGGTVKATSGATSAGIGGGNRGNAGPITINGGTVTATNGLGGDGDGYDGGTGIGGGAYGGADSITIKGGTVTATSGGSGAGIGGGKSGSGGVIKISGGTVTATSASGAGIGSGQFVIIPSTIEITGGSVKATGGFAAVSHQPTNGSDPVYLNTLTVGSAENRGREIYECVADDTGRSEYGYGFDDVFTDEEGKVYFWLPVNNSGDANVFVTLDNGMIYFAVYPRDSEEEETLIPSFGISLSVENDGVFEEAEAGYENPEPLEATVTNIGHYSIGALLVRLSGANADRFTLSRDIIGGIPSEGADSFTVTPITGLPVGTYTATVTVNGTQIEESVDVSFTVKADTPIEPPEPVDPPKEEPTEEATPPSWLPSGDDNDDDDSDPAPITRPLAPAEKWMTAANLRNPSRESLTFGVRVSAWEALTGKYYHDSIRNNAVEVRTYFDDPGLFTADSYVSGWVTGADVDKTRATFEKWFTNKIRVIHFDRAGMWEHPVRVAAKLDLAGWDTTRLVFYYYDPKTNLYRRLANPAYWIDANGYLRFQTEYAGEIIIAEGELEKR